MYNESPYEPIVIEIKSKKSDIKFHFKTSKEFKSFSFPESDLTKEFNKVYNEAKSLKPFDTYEIPDQNFRSLTKNFYFGYQKGRKFYNTDYAKKSGFNQGYTNIVGYHNVTGTISLHDTDFFDEFIKSKKVYKIAIFANSLLVSPIENFINYREKSSALAYDDTIYFYEMPYFTTKQYIPTPEETRNKFIDTYKQVNYTTIKENICNQQTMTKYIENIKTKLDVIIFDTVIFYWAIKKYSGYVSCQVIFNLILMSFQKLKKGGLLKFKVRGIDNYLILELITLVSKYFQHVFFFRSSVVGETVVYDDVICQDFLGVEEKLLDEMYLISKKWLNIYPECGMEFNLKTEKFVSSILKYDDTILSTLSYFYRLKLKNSTNGFKKAIEAYYYVNEFGDVAIDELLTKQLKNSVAWLHKHGIETKADYKIIDDKILKEEEELNFEMYKHKLKVGKESDINRYLRRLGYINYLNRLISLLDSVKYKKIMEKSCKLTLDKKYKIEEMKKVFQIENVEIISIGEGKDVSKSVFLELDLVSNKQNIFETINRLSVHFKNCYLYKSLLTMYDTTIYFVGLDYLKTPKEKNNKNIISYLTNIINNTITELERIVFYYENNIIFKDNKNKLREIQKKNDKDWNDYFN